MIPCNLNYICGNGWEGKLIPASKMCLCWGAEKMK